MHYACTLSKPTFSLSDGALDTRANLTKPQVAVSCPDKINRHGYDGWGREKSEENVVDEDLLVKWNRISALWTYFGLCFNHSYCVKHAEQLLQLLEETQPTSITTCNTTIKTYTNDSKLTIICKLQHLFIYRSYIVIAILNNMIFPHIARPMRSEILIIGTL